MKKTSTNRIVKLTILCLAINVFGVSNAQKFAFSLNTSNQNIQWRVRAQDSIGTDTSPIMQVGYNASSWGKATVPGTVFGSYVAQGLEKDPSYGDNVYKVDKTKYDKNFWYRTEFQFAPNAIFGKVWLNFEGVNRDGDIYLNGQFLGSLKGIVHRGKFDVTSIIKNGETNVLAVLIYLPVLPLNCSASPTYISSQSWDWMPYVPGLNSGITDDVYITASETVTIVDPWIRTKVPNTAEAEVSVNVGVKNHDTDSVSGVLEGVINPGNIHFSQNISLAGNEQKEISFDKASFPQLNISNPKLWWPNGYGNPNLYTVSFSLKINEKVSDTINVKFGIKEYTYDTEGGVLHLFINGQKLFVKGGNWGMSEYMLRCRGDEYDTKVRLHKEMNFNMIRNWIGSTTDAEFYEACDKYGIMVWDDFWLITTFFYWPREKDVFKNNVIEKIKRNRNHPCIAVWCGMNEATPPKDWDSIYVEAIEKYDANDRHYQPNSNHGNLSGSGPWVNFSPEAYFDNAPGSGSWGMRTEIGTAVFTTYESFKEFMPEGNMWPRNEMWNKHFFGPSAGGAGPDNYFNSVNTRYGATNNIKDFCSKSQLLNIETNKGMFEGWMHNMWDDASGILTWMSQSAYPSLVWQTYDYYYDLTGAYWGAKKACEPVHIQLSPSQNQVEVTNSSAINYSNLKASAEVFDFDGKKMEGLDSTVILDAQSNSVNQCFVIPINPENLASGKQTIASSVENGTNVASNINDGNSGSRWSSAYTNNEWIYIDLGAEQQFSGVMINWETAYGKSYNLQVSDDAVNWDTIYTNENGKGGVEYCYFPLVSARYVKMQGVKRATSFGFSIYEMAVFKNKAQTMPKVYFVRLKLKSENDSLLSENFYWRSAAKTDFSELNKLPKFELSTEETTVSKGDTTYIKAKITNPLDSGKVAFAIRVMPVLESTGKRILPVFMDDNYFTLMPGESKEIQMEFKTSLLNGSKAVLKVIPYNPYIKPSEPDTSTGTVAPHQNELSIYPNPVLNQLFVKGMERGEKIVIYNLQGLTLLQSNGSQVDVSALKTGVYLVKVIGKSRTKSGLFVKK